MVWRSIAVCSLLLAPLTVRGEERLEYNRDVRPILTAHCFSCHGPDSASRKASLRLDQRDAAIEMGAIVASDPHSSTLVERIDAEDESVIMPPPEIKKPLTAEQREILRRWIAEGAEYQPHWSLIPPTRGELPPVANEAWVRNPIDRFVLARLEAEGLAPAPEADRRMLARRVSYDLTGLPPSAELVREFVADTSPDAYEKLVDKLLASPQWGEHRGRYWLDYARYADTNGIHFDNFREMWSYRDWVIKAFNANLPFNQFTVENLAGDLLPHATLDQQIASGFNRCNITTNEGGAINEEYLVLYARDRTEATSTVWMGMTAGCAVCHSHKFDPLSQTEFYQLSAFFNNTTQAAMDGNVADTPPVVRVPQPADRDRYDALPALIAEATAKAEAYKQQFATTFDEWTAIANNVTDVAIVDAMPSDNPHLYASFDASAADSRVTIDGVDTAAPLNEFAKPYAAEVSPGSIELRGGTIAELKDVGDFDADQPFSVSAWLRLPKGSTGGAVLGRMDQQAGYRGWDLWLQENRIGTHLISTWPSNALKVITTRPLPIQKWVQVTVVYNGSKKAEGVAIYVDGVRQEVTLEANSLSDTTRIDVPLTIGQRYRSEPARKVALDELRVYRRELAGDEVARLANGTRVLRLLKKPAAEWTADERTLVFDYYLLAIDTTYPPMLAERRALETEKTAIEARGTVGHIMQEKPAMPEAYVLNRGEYDQRLDRVEPATPAMLPPMAEGLPRNRLGLAQWLVDPQHPLTARVTVNRCWQEVFGQGLVRTSGDFGVSGELPSHQELLDWLAIEFRDNGWNVKQLYRLLVTSATYRQAALVTPEKLERDPTNKLLSRGPRFRMDAEMVRDTALAISGLLTNQIGGPSVRPYQPPGVWEAVAMPESNTKNYKRDAGDALYRRSMYTFWKRSAPPAGMDVFNAPNREHCIVARERTNTPLQALATLNDEQYVEAARNLAQRALLEADDATVPRIQWMAERLVARPLTAAELAIVEKSLADLSAYYNTHPDDATKLVTIGESQRHSALDATQLAAWTMLANELMNLDEVLCK